MSLYSPAWADDRPFAFAYTTDIEAKGEKEIEQELTWSSGHANEAFQSVESRTELEYGITDNFQGSFYLNYDWSRTHDHEAPGPAETSSLSGVSGEFIYRLMNVYFRSHLVWRSHARTLGWQRYAPSRSSPFRRIS